MTIAEIAELIYSLFVQVMALKLPFGEYEISFLQMLILGCCLAMLGKLFYRNEG